MSLTPDSVIFKTLGDILLSGFSEAGVTHKVRQSYQTEEVPAGEDSTVWMNKISGPIRGFPKREKVWNPGTGVFDAITHFWFSPTFQFTAMTLQKMTDPDYRSANDISELSAMILQTDDAINSLAAAGIGVQRIENIRQSFWVDDRKQFEQSPSFDIVVTYRQTVGGTIAPAWPFELKLQRV